MVFALSDSLVQQICNALENQDQTFFVEAKSATLVPASGSADENSFYSLPEWNSSDGFNLRQDFVSTLHSPLAKDELQRILHSGRGVFKQFKNVLKHYPEVEKLWNLYKTKKMTSYINAWYNGLLELWGLEVLEPEPEDNEDAVLNDFVFNPYEEKDGLELVEQLKKAASEEIDTEIPEEMRDVFFEVWQHQFTLGKLETQTGIVCRSLSDEFAGCITSASVSKNTDNIVVLTSFYVPKKFRGLGIGTNLISMYIDTLKGLSKNWFLLTYSAIPEFLKPLLTRFGFKDIGTGFLAKIQ